MSQVQHSRFKWLLWLGAFSLLIVTGSSPAAETNLYATDHVLIRFKSGVRPQLNAASYQESLNSLLAPLGLPAGASLAEPEVSKLLRQKQSGGQKLSAASSVDLSRFFYLYLPPGMSVQQCLDALKNNPVVDYVEPDGIGTGGLVPDDPDFSLQWHHLNVTKPSASIHTPEAWDITQGSTNVLVAVLDTGLAADLVEFTNRVVPGYNFAYGNTNTADDYGHGTAVAGTLCANANNASFGAGVNWQCRLMPIKVLDSNNSGKYSWFAQGIDYAVAHGCKVINLSAGGTTSNSSVTISILNAISNGVIFVTITHNDSTGTIRFPGTITKCITVGATDQNDNRCGFSNYGPQIDLVAPGISIYTAGWLGTLQSWVGTSFSAPMVSGVSAMLAGLRPGIAQDEVNSLLCLGAEDQVGDATDTPGFDIYYGWGRLNAYNTVLLATTRIDMVQLTNGFPLLSWVSPANASNKAPYYVEYATALNGPWTTVTNSFSYQTNRTLWTDPAASSNNTARFYRVRIRSITSP
jgi:hypothetical protein